MVPHHTAPHSTTLHSTTLQHARFHRAARYLGTALVLGVFLGGCVSAGSDMPDPGTGDDAPTEAGGSMLPELGEGEVITEDLESPWGIARLKEGVLVSERDTGKIKEVLPDGETRTVGTVPEVAFGGEGGLLGITFGPGREQLYAYHTSQRGNQVVVMDWDGKTLGTPEIIFDGIDSGRIHNGGRLTLGPDEKLYVGTGDTGNPDLSQDPASPNGKVLRLELDGQTPPDNPDPRSAVFTRGHRNVQGLAFDTQGQLWASELGQDSFDELNLLQAGNNYGWPEVEGVGDQEGYTDPVAVWDPSEASPSGVAILQDTLYMAALRGEQLWQVELTGTTVGEQRSLLRGDQGRLRHVEPDGDAALWVLRDGQQGILLRYPVEE